MDAYRPDNDWSDGAPAPAPAPPGVSRRLGRWSAAATGALARLMWTVCFRSPRSMGFRWRSIVWARLGMLFFAGLIVYSLYDRFHVIAPAPQVIQAWDFKLRQGVAAAVRLEWLWRTLDIDGWVADAARRHGVDADLIHAVINAESNYRPHAISSVGACGLMQIMPSTVRHLGGGNPFDPRENIDMGARYLAELSRRFNHDQRLVVAAYNAGPGAVRRHGGVPPYTETQVYVERVMRAFEARKRLADTAVVPDRKTPTRRPVAL